MKKIMLVVVFMLATVNLKALELPDFITSTLIGHVGPYTDIMEGETRGGLYDSIIQIGTHNGESVFDGQIGYTEDLNTGNPGGFVAGGYLKLSPFVKDLDLFPDHWRFLNELEHGVAYSYDFRNKRDFVSYRIGLAFSLNPM